MWTSPWRMMIFFFGCMWAFLLLMHVNMSIFFWCMWTCPLIRTFITHALVHTHQGSESFGLIAMQLPEKYKDNLDVSN
jgi:hypothetical protein